MSLKIDWNQAQTAMHTHIKQKAGGGAQMQDSSKFIERAKRACCSHLVKLVCVSVCVCVCLCVSVCPP